MAVRMNFCQVTESHGLDTDRKSGLVSALNSERERFLGPSLLLSQVADQGQLKPIALVGFDHKQYPRNEQSNADNEVQEPSQDWNKGKDHHSKPGHEYRGTEEKALEGMEPHKLVLV